MHKRLSLILMIAVLFVCTRVSAGSTPIFCMSDMVGAYETGSEVNLVEIFKREDKRNVKSFVLLEDLGRVGYVLEIVIGEAEAFTLRESGYTDAFFTDNKIIFTYTPDDEDQHRTDVVIVRQDARVFISEHDQDSGISYRFNGQCYTHSLDDNSL